MRLEFLSACLICAAMLAGCGQKGPLYLPDKPGVKVPPQPAATPSATDKTDAAEPDKPTR